MNEAAQIKQVIAAARTMPRKIAVLVDSKGKEERFLKAFREALPASEFSITVMDLTVGGAVRSIFIECVKAHDVSAN